MTVRIAFLAILLVVAGRATSSSGVPGARVDALFARWNTASTPGCAVGVARNGETMLERGYGLASLEFGIPITPSSIFSAASISKQFTAMSIMLLARQGWLSLDDVVRNHIPELPDYGTPLTIRHLLNHTSGLRDGFGLDGGSAPRQDRRDPNDGILRVLVRQRGLNFTPGAEFRYDNGGYNMLGTS
jgi:CubicO group peptidase (beta-lactamase class C family)